MDEKHLPNCTFLPMIISSSEQLVKKILFMDISTPIAIYNLIIMLALTGIDVHVHNGHIYRDAI